MARISPERISPALCNDGWMGRRWHVDPRWSRGRAEKQRNVVVEYAGKTDLRVAWVDNVATISLKEDI